MSGPRSAGDAAAGGRRRRRWRLGMTLVIIMVGALFPAVGGSIGKLDVPEGVAELLGGADYGTIAGWMRSEIGAIYGPLVIAVVAIARRRRSSPARRRTGILGPGPRAPRRLARAWCWPRPPPSPPRSSRSPSERCSAWSSGSPSPAAASPRQPRRARRAPRLLRLRRSARSPSRSPPRPARKSVADRGRGAASRCSGS